MLLKLITGDSQIAGKFRNGDIAFDQSRGEIYLCVDTDTHSPQAFRVIFKIVEGEWATRFGNLVRVGNNREFTVVRISGEL